MKMLNSKFRFATGLNLFLAIILISACTNKTELEKKLNKISNIEISPIEPDSIYSEAYELWYTQTVDQNNPKSKKFKQRVIVNHVGFDRPTVVILEGYNIYSTKAGELSTLLNTNQITIEHRFFDESRPDTIPWEFLTIEQAALDQHKIIQSLKDIYPEKWVSTGISKGGQTTIYHRRFFPDDVDASVVYVAPFNLEQIDPRIAKHLETVGNEECRNKVRDFQLELFEKKELILPLLEKYASEKEYTFNLTGIERAYDLNALEYSFAFWQWSGNCAEIPDNSATEQEMFDHWKSIAPFSFFYDQDIDNDRVFTYQALTEIGFYDYDIKPFKKYLKDTANITFNFKIPDSIKVEYNSESMQDINTWIQQDGNFMLYLYGENDPWAATAVNPSDKTFSVKMTNPGGNHRTRIHSFPDDMKENIYTLLESWLDVSITREDRSGGNPGIMLEIL